MCNESIINGLFSVVYVFVGRSLSMHDCLFTEVYVFVRRSLSMHDWLLGVDQWFQTCAPQAFLRSSAAAPGK